MLEKLLAEQDGIVSKAAFAARKLIKNNFIFDIPKEALDILDEWCLEGKDSITRFLENQCMIGYECTVSSRVLYEEYKVFCSLNHIQIESQTLLSRRISELPGVHKTKKRLQKDGNPVWIFEGIGITDRV